jgi:hypothetical protein
MIERCEFEGCTVQHDSESKECQASLYWLDLSVCPARHLCILHFDLCEHALRDIPTAVTELHAWALLVSSSPQPAQSRLDMCAAAEERVLQLRKIEAWLKGA